MLRLLCQVIFFPRPGLLSPALVCRGEANGHGNKQGCCRRFTDSAWRCCLLKKTMYRIVPDTSGRGSLCCHGLLFTGPWPCRCPGGALVHPGCL